MKFFSALTRNILLPAAIVAAMFFGFQILKDNMLGWQSGQKVSHDLRPAEVNPDQYFLGKVVESAPPARVEIVSGAEAGKIAEVDESSNIQAQKGETVVVAKIDQAGSSVYFIADKYRFPALGMLVIAFFALAIFFGRGRGLASVVGLIVSIVVLARFLIPHVIAGGDPLTGSLIAAAIIAVVSLYLAHGFKKRTSIALGSMLLTLGLAAVLASVAVSFGRLFGLGSEDAFFLQQLSPFGQIDFRGLLLGGIIIGALGVLDDTTTIQSATVEELKKANPGLSLSELYRRGLSVGREHITSLVNTLFLAYAGAQLPLFLLFYAYPNQPLWVTLNSEFIAEELVRTLVGSAALILAVPITTFLAAYFFSRKTGAITD